MNQDELRERIEKEWIIHKLSLFVEKYVYDELLDFILQEKQKSFEEAIKLVLNEVKLITTNAKKLADEKELKKWCTVASNRAMNDDEVNPY